jgi:tetratricopeptide (TPR) repeat protein
MSASTPEAHALALFRAGRLAEAHAAWRAILERSPDDPQALHMTGYLLARLGRRDEGLVLIDRSIERAPRAAAFLSNRAQLLAEAGRIDEAIGDLRRAVQLDPGFAQGLCNLGILLQRSGRREEALAAFRRTLALDPANALAAYNAGVLLLEARDLPGAEAAFRRAVEREPRNAMALNNLGVVLRELGRDAEALAVLREACAADPRHAAAWTNLALVLRGSGDLDGAGDAYARAFDAGADSPSAWLDAASVALDRARLDEAESLYRRALLQRPGWADAEYGLGQVALRRHDFARGWEGYERRFDTDPPQVERRTFGLPPFSLADVGSGVRVAVWREQGVGDQILFSTLLPELANRGVAAVVEVDERLLPLHRRSLPALEFVTPAEAPERFRTCEREIALGSLARLFRRDAASFRAQPAALFKPDPARVSAIRERLGAGPWIGISWRSLQRGERRAMAERKSIPLEAFATLAASSARLLDLQYGDVEEERAAFESRHPGSLTRLEDLDLHADLEGVAAAIAACERIVTASNATAHLAGAVGARTQLLYLQARAPFSYWVPDGSGRCLWYPSIAVVTDAQWTQWQDALKAVS